MHGVINLIKPTGLTSSDVVVRVRKILHEKKVGHLGTLDPAASGVLPIAVGDATKLFDFYLKKCKMYRVIVKFGIKTDTLDSDGEVLQKTNVNISASALQKTLLQFIGKLQQTPPMYSAVHIDGKRAYELAREAQVVNLPKRNIAIYALKFVEQIDENVFVLDIHCSAGTYVRSLLEDIASSLKTYATMLALIRMQSGNFEISNACTLEELQENPEKYLASITKVLSVYPVLECSKEMFTQFVQGKVKEFICEKADEYVVLEYQQKAIALLEKQESGVYIPITKFLKEVM